MDRLIGRENLRHYSELNEAIGTLALMGGTNGHLTDIKFARAPTTDAPRKIPSRHFHTNKSGLRSPAFAKRMILLASISSAMSPRSARRSAMQAISNATPITSRVSGSHLKPSRNGVIALFSVCTVTPHPCVAPRVRKRPRSAPTLSSTGSLRAGLRSVELWHLLGNFCGAAVSHRRSLRPGAGPYPKKTFCRYRFLRYAPNADSPRRSFGILRR